MRPMAIGAEHRSIDVLRQGEHGGLRSVGKKSMRGQSEERQSAGAACSRSIVPQKQCDQDGAAHAVIMANGSRNELPFDTPHNYALIEFADRLCASLCSNKIDGNLSLLLTSALP